MSLEAGLGDWTFHLGLASHESTVSMSSRSKTRSMVSSMLVLSVSSWAQTAWALPPASEHGPRCQRAEAHPHPAAIPGRAAASSPLTCSTSSRAKCPARRIRLLLCLTAGAAPVAECRTNRPAVGVHRGLRRSNLETGGRQWPPVWNSLRPLEFGLSPP